MTRVIIKGEIAVAEGPFEFQFMKLLATLPGRKKWVGQKECHFDSNHANIRILKESWADLEILDKTGELKVIEELHSLATQHQDVKLDTSYSPKLPLKDYQKKGVALAKGRQSYAYLLEMGLGKTAMTICDIGILYAEFGLRGAVVSTKKGVDEQWAFEEIPKHIDPKIKYEIILWKGKPIEWKKLRPDRLHFFIMNTDSLRTERGFESVSGFIKKLDGLVCMAIDESHDIKNISASRSKAAIMIGQMCKWRRIMTGTPISKNIMDAFSQFYFLDPNILGHKYATSFRARYCIMGGFEGRQIVGQRRVEEFYSLVAPHSYRLTKAEALDLPPKIYTTVPYEMSAETSKHYNNLKKTLLTQLASGEIMTVANAVALTIKLQQLVCGYLPKENGEVEVISSERLDVMSDIIEQVEGPTVVWARFKLDIQRITERLEKEHGKGCVAEYYGETKKADRKTSVEEFLSGKRRFFVSTQGAGGTGLNLQGKCHNVIYYSNDYNALTRWQSEDRTHRIGTTGNVTYFDIVAQKSVDRAILSNLKGKKSISDLSLDQIRQMLIG